ncbi:hypothetical protein [Rhodoblastus sp.]|uniref:hypothetical protein n=1 Tax=Rhodoblastus sp. TaxID=1962975 RepID=UPI003F9501C6
MKTQVFRAALALAGAFVLAPAIAQDAVQLAPRPPVAKDVDAFPRLKAGAPAEVMARIDKALDADEARLRASRKDCLAQAEGHGDWSRTVEVTMAGPGFLSYVARDQYFCGGAHPDFGALALVFDLRAGRPVDLVKLLPGLHLKGALDSSADGAQIGTIASPELTALYRKLTAPGLDADCKSALDNENLIFIAWPDAKAGGLVIEPENLPHVIAACGDDATLDAATLEAAQAAPELLEALRARPKP